MLESPSTLHHNRYPNPGYLGPSSHIDIFNHILSEQDSNQDVCSPKPFVSGSLDEHPSVKQGALLTRQLLSSFDLEDLRSLVTFWRAKGVNLAVAEPFVDLCAEISNYTSLSRFQGSEWHHSFSTRLLQNTTRPLEYNPESTLSSYSAQFLGANTRWETFGIFLSAVIQATRDISFFPSLYTTSSRNRELRHLLTRLLDCSLDICLSTDCLNDLQLILQYEHFIVHSYVDGDQSRSTLPVIESCSLIIKAIDTGEPSETSLRLFSLLVITTALIRSLGRLVFLWSCRKLYLPDLTLQTKMSLSFLAGRYG